MDSWNVSLNSISLGSQSNRKEQKKKNRIDEENFITLMFQRALLKIVFIVIIITASVIGRSLVTLTIVNICITFFFL